MWCGISTVERVIDRLQVEKEYGYVDVAKGGLIILLRKRLARNPVSHVLFLFFSFSCFLSTWIRGSRDLNLPLNVTWLVDGGWAYEKRSVSL